MNDQSERLSTADIAGRSDAKDERAKDERKTSTENESTREINSAGMRDTKVEDANKTADAGRSTTDQPPAGTYGQSGNSPSSTGGDVTTSRPNMATMSGTKGEAKSTDDDDIQLVSESDAGRYRDRWSEIQTNFVDEPKSSVETADTLVAEVIQSLAQRFADERQRLDQQWHSGSDVSTEDLRQALRHYRVFFQRLLAA